MKQSKKFQMTIVIIIILIILGASMFSLFKFNVINPVSSCLGLIQILLTEKEYTIVQNYPNQVILAKPDTKLLEEYMKKRGFTEKKEEQMASEYVYSDGTKKEYVHCSVNSYYAKWIWKQSKLEDQ